MPDPSVDVPLASAIEALRRELVSALEKGKDQEVRFAVGPVELEFQVQIEREAEGEAGVKFWVVTLGGKGSQSSAATHTVRVNLTPVLAADVGTDRPLVVGSKQVNRPR
jgi:Trypsin-co-occurring domain 2